MICPPCKRAGEANALQWFTISLAEHEKCESPNCPCQHKTGQYINTEALNK